MSVCCVYIHAAFRRIDRKASRATAAASGRLPSEVYNDASRSKDQNIGIAAPAGLAMANDRSATATAEASRRAAIDDASWASAHATAVGLPTDSAISRARRLASSAACASRLAYFRIASDEQLMDSTTAAPAACAVRRSGPCGAPQRRGHP